MRALQVAAKLGDVACVEQLVLQQRVRFGHLSLRFRYILKYALAL
jgi:hypothetical protein